MRTLRHTFSVAIAALGLLGVLSRTASADTILISDSSGGGEYTYIVQFTAGTSLVKDDSFFTIFDFGGFTEAMSTKLDFDFASAQNLGTGIDSLGTPGTNPAFPDDHPAIPNVTFRYTGEGETPIFGFQIGLKTSLGDPADATEFVFSRDTVSEVCSAVVQDLIVPADPLAAVVPLPGAAWGGMVLLGMLGAAKLRKVRKS